MGRRGEQGDGLLFLAFLAWVVCLFNIELHELLVYFEIGRASCRERVSSPV